eukprot:jgi/Chrzof1/3021/Cz12g08150.t1
MFVPSDSFGGVSPEKKAANHLRTLFTFVAVKVILAQLEGSGRGSLAAYNQQSYQMLSDQLSKVSFKDGDDWVEQLMQHDPHLALRVMEVRDAYCREDFEWDQLRKVALRDMKDANVKLMRKSAVASLKASETLSAEQRQAPAPDPGQAQ